MEVRKPCSKDVTEATKFLLERKASALPIHPLPGPVQALELPANAARFL
jgi:hypothetical protein